MTDRDGNIPMSSPGHFDGFDVKWRGFFDVMFSGINPPDRRDHLISKVSIGVLDDMGYWVNYYGNYRDVQLTWGNDPRDENRNAKIIAEYPQWYCIPPRVEVARSLDK